MSDPIALAPAASRALTLIAQRLGTEPALPWLLAGEAAAVMQGVAMDHPPVGLLLFTGAPELARVAALLAAEERAPLATRAAPGYAASPRGSYELAGVVVDLVGDAVATGAAGALALPLEHVWPLRIEARTGGERLPLLPLELALAIALIQGRQGQAHAIADHLLATGVRWERLDGVLAELPALEPPLWELMDKVRPLANRARSRRARQQLGWGQDKKKRK
jgi:hypothetical protein